MKLLNKQSRNLCATTLVVFVLYNIIPRDQMISNIYHSSILYVPEGFQKIMRKIENDILLVNYINFRVSILKIITKLVIKKKKVQFFLEHTSYNNCQ